jgi:nitrogenase molybdenum-iron protein NifN
VKEAAPGSLERVMQDAAGAAGPAPAVLPPRAPLTQAVDPRGEPAVNACKLCAPLGASIAFRGIEGGMALLHGSQGCATYIRRYLISHFREPVDIASSNFSEASVVHGGAASLRLALSNVQAKYQPSVVGVATTCLAETLGEDLKGQLLQRAKLDPEGVPAVLVHTPSFKGTHAEGYLAAVRAIAEHFAVEGPSTDSVNLLPGLISPEDLRLLKGLMASFGLDSVLLPDYSDTLDGGTWEDYQPLSPGGTPLDQLAKLGTSWASLELGATLGHRPTAAAYLEERFGVARQTLPLPIGVSATDAFIRCLAQLADREIPEALRLERGRLLDAYADGHKSLFGLRVGVYGEEDLACGLAAWLAEVGCTPVLVASGGESGRLQGALESQIEGFDRLGCRVMQGADFTAIREAAQAQGVQLLMGNSKGYPTARALGLPLLRAGFPVHDRFGGARLLHLGYAGALRLYDSLVNLVLERKQASSSVGYGYL